MTMIIDPVFTSVEDVASLFNELPPRNGETLKDWSERTGTEFQGDCGSLISRALPPGIRLSGGKFVKDEDPFLVAMWIHS